MRQECELARVDCLVSPLYRKRKLMNNTEAKELLGMCISECKRQAIDTAKQAVRSPSGFCCEASLRSVPGLINGVIVELTNDARVSLCCVAVR